MTQTATTTIDRLPPDTIRAAVERVFASPDFDWREIQTPDLWEWLTRQWQALLDWSRALATDHPVLYWLLFAILSLLAIALLTHLGFLVWRGIASARSPEVRSTEPREVRNAAWYLAEAQRLRDSGRITDALGYRFVALLLQMDRRKAVRYHPSKTPGEYVGEADLAEEGRSALHELVATLYRFLFGGESPTPEDFDRFDQRAAELGGEHATL